MMTHEFLVTGTRIGQASECFIYWKDTMTNDTWGLNFTSPIDAKQFKDCCVSIDRSSLPYLLIFRCCIDFGFYIVEGSSTLRSNVGYIFKVISKSLIIVDGYFHKNWCNESGKALIAIDLQRCWRVFDNFGNGTYYYFSFIEEQSAIIWSIWRCSTSAQSRYSVQKWQPVFCKQNSSIDKQNAVISERTLLSNIYAVNSWSIFWGRKWAAVHEKWQKITNYYSKKLVISKISKKIGFQKTVFWKPIENNIVIHKEHR